MTEKTDIAARRDSAECMANLLDNLAGYEPQDIDMDTVEIRFEDGNGFDTGCDISIVDTAQKSADIIRSLLDQLEAERQQREAAEKERDALKSAHDNLVTRCALLRQRPDLPIDRIPAYEALVKAQDALRVSKSLWHGQTQKSCETWKNMVADIFSR